MEKPSLPLWSIILTAIFGLLFITWVLYMFFDVSYIEMLTRVVLVYGVILSPLNILGRLVFLARNTIYRGLVPGVIRLVGIGVGLTLIMKILSGEFFTDNQTIILIGGSLSMLFNILLIKWIKINEID